MNLAYMIYQEEFWNYRPLSMSIQTLFMKHMKDQLPKEFWNGYVSREGLFKSEAKECRIRYMYKGISF